ncbi:MAG: hypothetical protein Q8L10_02805 [Candidatus Moranbacteria bacterium]|nr:hypothetical protein [Candidatus Moranbacteria bacterium]
MLSFNIEVHGYSRGVIGIQIRDEILELFSGWELDKLAVTLYEDESNRQKLISTPFLRVYHDGGKELKEVIEKLRKFGWRIELVRVVFIASV